jgi:hypothetical protein
MNMWRVGEDMGSKEMDRCPFTITLLRANKKKYSPDSQQVQLNIV